MRRRYVTADVFTREPFGGNPLAVVLDAQNLSSAQMQAIAAEFNYSETTFVLPPADPANTAQIRIFTPRSELPFAGHPNVGTAFVLARETEAQGKTLPPVLRFEEKAGLVPVALLREGNQTTGAELTAPQPLSRRRAASPGQAAACLRLSPADIRTDAHAPELASVGLSFLVVELASRDALRRAQPDLAAHAELLPGLGTNGIYAYTRDAEGDPSLDVQARLFAPLDGVVEDPATGSATAAAAALIAEVRGAADLKLRFAQGVDMGRPSLLDARVARAGGDAPSSVHVGGHCVPVMEGTFALAGRDR